MVALRILKSAQSTNTGVRGFRWSPAESPYLAGRGLLLPLENSRKTFNTLTARGGRCAPFEAEGSFSVGQLQLPVRD